MNFFQNSKRKLTLMQLELYYMLDNDNVINTIVSEAVEKIPTAEKDYRNASLRVLLCTATAYQHNWHMISFIYCGSEKRVYRFPSGNLEFYFQAVRFCPEIFEFKVFLR